MKLSYRTPQTMIFLVAFALFFTSCAKDSDLFDEYVLAPEEEVVEPGDQNGDTDGDTDQGQGQDPDQNPPTDGSNDDSSAGIDFGTPDNFENTNKIDGTYYPKSEADITNPAHANFKAVISESFECNGCTFAPNQTIEPAGGVISGSNINLNGAYIENTYKQAFSPSVSFSQVYEASRVSAETFGAISGDNIDDSDAIDALINYSRYAVGSSKSTYIKNKQSVITRSGTFDWNMNECIIKTTTSSFMDNSVTKVYLFDIKNLSPKIYNGEFDGNNSYGRLMYLKGQKGFHFEDLYVHDYYSPVTAEAAAFRFDLYPQSYGSVEGRMYNCTIDRIVAEKDYIANNTPGGIAKGVLMYLWQSGTGNIYFEGNTITNILGDDAEAVLVSPASASMSNNTHFYFKNETYKNAQRRQMKITTSNVHLTDCYFESPGQAPDFPGQAAALVAAFSTNSNQPLLNFESINCDYVSNGVHSMLGLYLTDIKDAKIENNRFNYSSFSNYVGLSLGTGVSGYTGSFENVSITNNEFTNCGVQVSTIFNPVDVLTLNNNTFEYDISSGNPGAYIAAVRFLGTSGTYSNFHFIDNSIFVSGSNNLFAGVLYMRGANLSNTVFDNVEINYTNGSVTYPWALIGTPNQNDGNYGSTNKIMNCKIIGDIGTGAISILGSDKSVNISNSFGDGSTAITSN